MRYAMLICGHETAPGAATGADPGAGDGGMAEIYAWFEKWTAAGKIADGGAELEGVRSERTIRGAGANQAVTDGPFIETKEAIGGFVILEAQTMEEALEVAGTWPGLVYEGVSVEVRPTVDHSGDAPA